VNKMKIKKICEQCGREFSSIIPSTLKYRYSPIQWEKRKFCSIKCSALSRKTSIKISCAYCGKIIEKQPNEIRKHNFCSIKCRAKFNGEKEKEKRQGKTYEEIYGIKKAKEVRKNLKSSWNPKNHIPTAHAREVWKQNFLGNKLREGLSPYNKGLPKNKQPNWKGKYREITCLTCGKKKWVQPYDKSIKDKLKDEYPKYCSKKCFYTSEEFKKKWENEEFLYKYFKNRWLFPGIPEDELTELDKEIIRTRIRLFKIHKKGGETHETSRL